MKKIFISYSLRGKDITINDLIKFKNKINLISKTEIYIDIIENEILDDLKTDKIQLNSESINNYYQKRLKEELISSDFLFLIKSKYADDSLWIKEELLFAKKKLIPIILITRKEFFEFLNNLNNKEMEFLKYLD